MASSSSRRTTLWYHFQRPSLSIHDLKRTRVFCAMRALECFRWVDLWVHLPAEHGDSQWRRQPFTTNNRRFPANDEAQNTTFEKWDVREDNEQVKRLAHCAFFRSNRDLLLTGQENKTQYAINYSKLKSPGKKQKKKTRRSVENITFLFGMSGSVHN